jgi:uncharacterized protein (DUF58 family)
MAEHILARWWRGLDKPGWRNFAIAMAALGIALALSLYSAAAAEVGQVGLAAASAVLSLALAGWVAVTIVPALARRTSLRWWNIRIQFRLTREGGVYIAGIFLLALAALNTGNNLLFLILAAMLAGILMSGVLSTVVLSGNTLELEVPEHIFAGQPALALVKLRNEKDTLPSFSLRIVADQKKGEKNSAGGQVLLQPVYFPFIPRQTTAEQRVELLFPRRGLYRQDAFGIRTRFPFGFLEKTRRVESPVQVLVYPPVSPTDEFYEILPLVSGELESYYRGRGHDLYSIRDYQSTDSARFVDWKASARTGGLKVREFTREDERQVVLVLDPVIHEPEPGQPPVTDLAARFERGVALCACLAWHFYQVNAEIAFRMEREVVPMGPAGESIYEILRELALVVPRKAEGAANALLDLATDPHSFKIILTSQPRGTIPTSLWSSSSIWFWQSL